MSSRPPGPAFAMTMQFLLDHMFSFCSNAEMVDASTAEIPYAASPASDEAVRETEVLSGLTKLALEMARTFQAQGLGALAAGDLDRAGKAETRFSIPNTVIASAAKQSRGRFALAPGLLRRLRLLAMTARDGHREEARKRERQSERLRTVPLYSRAATALVSV